MAHAGTLLSVNVGLPRDVSWQGRTVHTAVWKEPVEGPARVRRLNIDGDRQGDLAGHGGEHRAVFVYQLGSYRYWEQQLGRSDFSYGQFGENFTVDGLPDDRVRIGDRFQIGSALFEVTQPRVTCYRVGIRMGDPRMPAMLISHHRPGFYLRVLREGEVRAGDEIVQIAAGPEPMSVAEVDGLLYLPGHPRQKVLRAMRIPALPDGWKTSFQALLDQPEGDGNAGLTSASPPPAWRGFRPLAVTEITRESASVVSIYLADPDGTAVPPALPGQFLTLRLPVRPDARPISRSYSLSGEPGAKSYRVSVKREPHGTGSQFVNDQLRAGDRLDVAAPRGTFVLRSGKSAVLLVSAGVGATPVLAMLHALAAENSDREIWWLHAARSRADEPFAAEARSLLAAMPNAHRRVWYSRLLPAQAQVQDGENAGHLSSEALAELGLPHDAETYICGPTAFMTEVSATLASLGVDGTRIRTEIFGAAPSITPGIAGAPAVPPHPPRGQPGTGREVAFARSGLSVHWDDHYASLLELAEACDVPVRWSCRTGVCHTCETSLLSGEVSYSPDPVDEPADGSVLICCSEPDGDLELDL